MAQFAIGERCLFWEPNGRAVYGTVVKVNPDAAMVLLQTNEGINYLKQNFEVIKTYGRNVR